MPRIIQSFSRENLLLLLVSTQRHRQIQTILIQSGTRHRLQQTSLQLVILTALRMCSSLQLWWALNSGFHHPAPSKSITALVNSSAYQPPLPERIGAHSRNMAQVLVSPLWVSSFFQIYNSSLFYQLPRPFLNCSQQEGCSKLSRFINHISTTVPNKIPGILGQESASSYSTFHTRNPCNESTTSVFYTDQ